MRKESPGRGGTSPENMLRIEFNAVFPKKRQIFIFKAQIAMLKLLIANVILHGGAMGHAHPERAISFLPGKTSSLFVHPFDPLCLARVLRMGPSPPSSPLY